MMSTTLVQIVYMCLSVLCSSAVSLIRWSILLFLCVHWHFPSCFLAGLQRIFAFVEMAFVIDLRHFTFWNLLWVPVVSYVWLMNNNILNFDVQPYMAGELTDLGKPFEEVISHFSANRAIAFALKANFLRLFSHFSSMYIEKFMRPSKWKFPFKYWDTFFLFLVSFCDFSYYMLFELVWMLPGFCIIFWRLCLSFGLFLSNDCGPLLIEVSLLYKSFDHMVHTGMWVRRKRVSLDDPIMGYQSNPKYPWLHRVAICLLRCSIVSLFPVVLFCKFTTYVLCKYTVIALFPFCVGISAMLMSIFRRMGYNCDREYSKSKAGRRAERSAKKELRNCKKKTVSDYEISEKRRRRQVGVISDKRERLQARTEELDDVMSSLSKMDFKDEAGVKRAINQMRTLKKHISSLSAGIARVSEDLEKSSGASEKAFNRAMKYNGGGNTILDSLITAISELRISGDKVKIALGIYSEFSNFCRCSTTMDYVDFCISLVSRFVDGDTIVSNLSAIKGKLTNYLQPEMGKQGLREIMDLPNRPVTKLVKCIVGLGVVLFMSVGLVDKNNLPSVIDFALDLPKKIEAPDILSYAHKALNFCISTIPFYNGQTHWGELFNGTTTAQIVANECADLSNQYFLYKSGDPLENSCTHKLPLPGCYSRAMSLCDRISRELKFKSGSEAICMRRELERIHGWKQFFLEKMLEEEIVVAPYFMAFRSVPGVGKTSVQRYMAITVAKNNGFPCGDNDIAARNPDDKYASRGYKSIMMMDDYHQCIDKLRESNETLYAIRAANNQKMMDNSADLESKGRVPVNPNVLTLSANGDDWRPEQDISEPTAFLRRINLNVTNVFPLERYRKRDSIVLDPGRALGHVNTWQMNLGYYRVEISTALTPRPVEMFYRQDGTSTCNIREAYNFTLPEALEFAVRDSKLHYAQQRGLKSVLEGANKNFCEHEVNGEKLFFPEGGCPICTTEIEVTTPLDRIAMAATGALRDNGHQSFVGAFPYISTVVGYIFYSGVFQRLIRAMPSRMKWWIYNLLYGVVFYYAGVICVWFSLQFATIHVLSTRPGFIISDWLRRLGSTLLRDTYTIAKDRICCFADTHKWKILLVLAVAMIVGCYHFSHQGSVQFGNKPDEWQKQNVNYQIFLNDKNTTSYEDAVRLIKNSTVSFTLTFPDGVTDRGNMIPYKGHYYIMNKHYLRNGTTPCTIRITRYDESAPQSVYSQELNGDFIHFVPDTDLAVVYMPKTMRNIDFSGFFTDTYPSLPVRCRQFFKRGDGVVEETMVTARPAPCRIASDFVIENFWYSRSCFNGLCGAPIVSESKRPVILGIHWAGSLENLPEGCSAFINKRLIERGVADIEKKTGIHCGAIPKAMKMQSYVEAPLEGKVSFSYLPKTGSLTYLGRSDAPIVNNMKPCVRKTELHDIIQAKTGFEPRGPHVEFNYGPVYDAQISMAHSDCKDVNWKHLSMARDDWLANALKDKNVVSDLSNLRVLSNQEALDGTSVPGEEPMQLNTSKGPSYLGYGGKKNVFFSRDLDGNTTPPEGFFDKLAELEEEYAAGFTRGMPFSQTLKQEVLFKPKARVFSVSDVEHLVLVRKYFLTLCSLLRRHNSTFENVIGANVYGPDWQNIIDYVTKFGRDRLGFGDYKHYDQSLKCLEILVAFCCLITLAEKSGNYSQRELTIMWGLANDLANPIYIGNGIFFGASGTSPSGHSLTTVLNNISNAIRHRMAYYGSNPKIAKPVFNVTMSCEELDLINCDMFSNNVALMTQGDDHVFSVKEGVVFGMLTMQKYLEKMGVIYTDADKASIITSELRPLEEMTFLKRSVGRIDGIPQYVAPLAIKSIWKPTMMHVPSNVLTSSQQLALAIDDAMRESFYHGRVFYNDMKDFFSGVIIEKEVEQFVDPASFRPYDTRVFEWRETFVDQN